MAPRPQLDPGATVFTGSEDERAVQELVRQRLQLPPAAEHGADRLVKSLGNFRQAIYQVLPEILELWGENMATDITSKKNIPAPSGK